jgi:CubicO group peptidase (beta-lactamase class C family)
VNFSSSTFQRILLCFLLLACTILQWAKAQSGEPASTMKSREPSIARSGSCQTGRKSVDFDEVQRSLQPVVNAYLQTSGGAGLSIGIYRDGDFYCFNYGEMDQDSHIAPTSRTLYEIGSVTKTFTGILLAQAVEDRKLALEDDVRKYLPGSFPNLSFDGHPIRVKDLASQTSGLPHNSTKIPDGATPELIVRLEKENDTAHFLDSLHAVHLDHVPGRDLQYSNTSFGLLGIILERVYQMPFEELVRNKLARSLGMQNTSILLSNSQEALFALGHAHDGAPRPSLILGVPGSGGLRSNIDDLLLYARANAEAKSGPLAVSHQLCRRRRIGWRGARVGDRQDWQGRNPHLP